MVMELKKILHTGEHTGNWFLEAISGMLPGEHIREHRLNLVHDKYSEKQQHFEWQQHDAREFLSRLLYFLEIYLINCERIITINFEKLEEGNVLDKIYLANHDSQRKLIYDYKVAGCNDIFKLFYFQEYQRTFRTRLNTESIVYGEKQILELNIQDGHITKPLEKKFKTDIKTMLNNYFKITTFYEDVELYPDQNITQEKKISILPNYFIIMIKRSIGFWKLKRMEQHKMRNLVIYPEDRDMKDYLHESSSEDSTKYKLYSVCIHIGESTNSGHYYSYCKRGDEWYEFDDSLVTLIQGKKYLNDQNAYILFYERM